MQLSQHLGSFVLEQIDQNLSLTIFLIYQYICNSLYTAVWSFSDGGTQFQGQPGDVHGCLKTCFAGMVFP